MMRPGRMMKNYLHCSKCPTSVRKNHEKSTCPITFGKNGHSLDMKAADEKLFLQARSFLTLKVGLGNHFIIIVTTMAIIAP
ncbi:uncharacterized protein LOC105071405 isoform X3 [Camelus bactrianus]|uniref:Uncharacterized protein LOC105071405 isoform X3 n=3 Tax=Camelus bactrianus TaxID=9837 RepID=A0AC58PF10_CAMBA